MDEHAEERYELAEIERDDRDDERENALDLFFAQSLRPVNDE